MTADARYRAAVKWISDVEADIDKSNQHELNGNAALRSILGSERRMEFSARWILLRDEGDPLIQEHVCSWYDSRERHATRSEWRLYYRGAPPLASGDLLVCLTRSDTPEVVFLVSRSSSTWASQLLGLFGAPKRGSGSFELMEPDELPDSHRTVLSALLSTLEWTHPEDRLALGDADLMVEKFGARFPETRAISDFARELVGTIEGTSDDLLLAWWNREEALFRGLEERLLSERLSSASPFSGVEEFLQFSLSVQNRRKSRAGHALENHVEALLHRHGLRYSRQSRTEGDRRPDFLLPGSDEYRDTSFPADHLTMLAVKTSCKDRWRQVLNEAERIPKKHLLTLEPGISKSQITEMQSEGLTLVAPASLLGTYDCPSGYSPLSVADFLGLAEARQSTLTSHG